MKKSQMMSVLCAASMVVSLLTGCGGENKPANSEKTEIVIEETKRDSAGYSGADETGDQCGLADRCSETWKLCK